MTAVQFSLPASVESDIIRHARVIPLDVVQAKGNGHAGTAVGLTPLLTTLYNHHLRHNPAHPDWVARDRFILSCGHTSLSLYLQLFLSGYGLEMSDLQAARKLGSITPGHPERGVTPGVEMSTGPLGQGLCAAVGVAMAERRVREMLTPGQSLDESPFGYRTWCLASDGDMFEGISSEAAALAGTVGLPGLIVLWDDNGISIDGPTSISTQEDVAGRFASAGWRVLEIGDAENTAAISQALHAACEPDSQARPTFIRVRTRIGNPMPTVGGTSKAHAGAVGADEIAATKQILGLDPHESCSMPQPLLEASREWARRRGAELEEKWERGYATWRSNNAAGAKLFDRLASQALPKEWDAELPDFTEQTLATRVASGQVLTSLVTAIPEIWGGSCDLSGSTSTDCGGVLEPFTRVHAGRSVYFGIREHAQAATLSGMCLSGLTRPFGSTYLAFSDYQKPAIRLASIMKLPSIFIWTHDSLAVGEDGPTHQPVEQIATLRAVPGFSVIRPGDAWETRAVWTRIVSRRDGPVGLVLSRQNLPVLHEYRDIVAQGAQRGGYVLADFPSDSQPQVILIATGSEVHVALKARELLAHSGISARVVSMPCVEWFEAQNQKYRDSVLPPLLRARVSVEAGIGAPWGAYVGLDGACVSVEQFGQSGDGAVQLADAGFTADHVSAVATRIVNQLL